MSAAEQATNVTVVRRLCDEWVTLTREAWAELMTPDCHYVNVPWPDRPRIGPDQTYEALRRYHDQGWTVGLETHVIVAEGDLVLAERTERFQKPGESEVHVLPVTGVFEMSGGKIAKWRDYFDSRQTDPLFG